MRQFLALFLLLAGLMRAQQASVSGTAVDQTTGQPLRGVHVRLVTGDFGGGGVDAIYGAMSDQAGHFSVDGMKPGFYIVFGERAGFLPVVTPGSAIPFGTVSLKADEHLTDFKLAMAARATISGRVVDDFADPVEGISVTAEVAPPGKSLEEFGGNRQVNTDDRGEFRLVIGPGKYVLQTRGFSNGGTGAEIRTDGTSGAPFLTTYYPSATEIGAASAVQVGPGQDVAGVEIHLVRSAAAGTAGHGFAISGVVTGTPADGIANVQLRSGEKPGEWFNGRGVMAGPDGHFSVQGMQAGYYKVSATYGDGKQALQSRAVEFHLESGDQTNLQLALLPGEDVSGLLEFVGGGTATAPETAAVRLESAGFYGSGMEDPSAAPVGKDGAFHLTNIMPGKYKMIVEPMPENAYLKQVALDGKALLGGVLDFSQGVGGSRLKVTVSRSGARLSGRILGKDGQVETGLLMVFLATDSKDLDDENAKHVHDGNYSFEALAPGKYHLFALDVAQMISAFSGGDEEDLMKRFFDAAETIDIKDGDRVQKDISAFTKIPEKK